jgi:exodeoxyribonuclease X
MTAYIIDTETTGFKYPREVTEVAYQEITWNCISSGLTSLLEGYSPFDILNAVFQEETANRRSYYLSRFKPNKKIEEGAAKITGITDELVKDCPPSSSLILPKMTYFIAHNAVFDYDVLGKPDVMRICTMEIAQNIFAAYKKDGLKNNKLGSLIEFFYPNESIELLATSHGALQDIKLVYLLLLKIAEKLPKADSFEYLLRYCSQGSAEEKPQSISDKRFKQLDNYWYIEFGKHKGTRLNDVPRSYLMWLHDVTQFALEKELIRKYL